MAEPDLTLIMRQLERILAEQRSQRELLALLPAIRDEQALQRGELQLLREQLRIHSAAIARLNDTITLNVLDRLQKLESD